MISTHGYIHGYIHGFIHGYPYQRQPCILTISQLKYETWNSRYSVTPRTSATDEINVESWSWRAEERRVGPRKAGPARRVYQVLIGSTEDQFTFSIDRRVGELTPVWTNIGLSTTAIIYSYMRDHHWLPGSLFQVLTYFSFSVRILWWL